MLIGYCREGRILGRDEGRLLGLEKGFEMGYEMGIYIGCICILRSALESEKIPGDSAAKVERHVQALYVHMTDKSPVSMALDPRKEELHDYVNDVRSKFKVIMTLIDRDTRRRILRGTGIFDEDIHPAHGSGPGALSGMDF